MDGFHGFQFLLMLLYTDLPSDDIQRGIPSGLDQPSDYDRLGRKAPCFLSQPEENDLEHFVGEMSVTGLSPGRRMDRTGVTTDHLRERVIVTLVSVGGQQDMVRFCGHRVTNRSRNQFGSR